MCHDGARRVSIAAGGVAPVNQEEEIDQSDSFLPAKMLAFILVFYFKNWLNK